MFLVHEPKRLVFCISHKIKYLDLCHSKMEEIYTPYVKLTQPVNELVLLCRGCLANSGEMKNIIDWGLVEDFYRFTDIRVVRSEDISELICCSCEEALLKCKEFRNQCQQSDVLLKDTAKINSSPQSKEKARLKQKIKTEHQIEQSMTDNSLVISITATDIDSKIYLPCPYESMTNCTEKFLKKNVLQYHLLKTHRINNKAFNIDLKYYCSYDNCKYNIKSGNKSFTERKFLNQHYFKVHESKIYHCNECSFKSSKLTDYERHKYECNCSFVCGVCDRKYKAHERLLVHLKRSHPEHHLNYKNMKRSYESFKKVSETVTEAKKPKNDLSEYMCDSPKISSSTQTTKLVDLEMNIRNYVTLPSWYNRPEVNEAKTDEISTQTVFEDLLSLKSQTSEDDCIFFSENVSLSDIQTQTFPVEFGLSRSNKETITSETQSPDLSIKETQTCFCLYESPKFNLKIFDSVTSSPSSINLTSTETQTSDLRTNVKTDVMLSFSSAETQTSFEGEHL